MTKAKAAIFASGTGSNFEAITKEVKAGNTDCEIAMLVCDKPDAQVVKKAAQHDVPTFVFDPKNYQSKEDFEQEIQAILHEAQVEWVILAGYMRLIGPTLLNRYKDRIINIHPSLLPSFPGKDAIGQAIHAGVKITGVTVHFVDAGLDTGKIIAQEAIRIEKDETKLSLQNRIQKIEHHLYPKIIQHVINTTDLVRKEGKENE
jgi:phosphoribosylglycinamide formyltransferase-1